MESPSSRTREVPRSASLATRFAALFSILVGAAVVLAGWLIYSGNREEVLEGRERDLEHRARTVQVRIESEVSALANDVLFLAKSPFLRRLGDAWNQERPPQKMIAEVQGTFVALLNGKPSYAQTRVLQLADEGEEIIRIDHLGDQVVVRPPENLQAKGHRDYFRESAGLAEGEVYLSPLNLNREFGEISLPRTPTLRAAAKVFDSTGQPFGLVVINVDLRPLFSELQATAGEEVALYLANADGDYLIHPDPAKTFGFDLGQRVRLHDDFGPRPVSSPESEREIVRFLRFPIRQESARNLIVGVGVPRASVLSELAAIRNRSLAAALAAAAVAAVLVWALAFLLSRRLSFLADAIGQYEPGGGAPVLPEKGSDEVAVVARKFSALSAKIDEQVQALEMAREEADENRRAKEDFLATLSHEIRTPMNAVTGLLHTLATDRPADYQLPTIKALQFASRQLIAVVNDVLDFSKIEAGHITFKRMPFDLHELLASIQTSHLPQARDGEIDLTFEQDANLPRQVSGDSLRLYQVLNNLVQNALKFTKPGGSVVVKAQVEENHHVEETLALSFAVEDTGVGMTDQELEQALSRYGQVQPGSSHKFGGTGLGLPIARMLVELQGGMFEAASTPGTGSRFQFRLQFESVQESETPPADALAHSVPDLGESHILCVEDVASNRQVVAALLEPSGATLKFAKDAAETLIALERCEQDSTFPDLILLDLQLPDRDGASLAADLRERWPQIPIIGLTAQTSGSLLEKCRQAGVNTFLWKPIEPDRLFETVAKTVYPDADAQSIDSHDPPCPVKLRSAPVLALFDGDLTKSGRYLRTLATELEDSAAALTALCSEGDHEGLRAMHHRLQNGLTLVGAGSVLDSIDALSAAVQEPGTRAHEQVHHCHALLRQTAGQLRNEIQKRVPTSAP